MSSKVADDVYEVDLCKDNQGYAYLDPVSRTYRETGNEMLSGMNQTPRAPMPRPDNPANQVETDKNLPLLKKNASLKKVNSVLIFVVVVYGILLLIQGLINFGVIGLSQGEARDGNQCLQVPVSPPGVNTVITGPQVPDGSPGPQGPPGTQGVPGICPENCAGGTAGAVYVRWGRSTCPSVSEIAYKGIAGGKLSNHPGSGSNYLCLPEIPEYDVYNAGVDPSRGYVYSGEYEIQQFPELADKFQHDAPCAVCRTTNRSSVMMIPAIMSCPSGWTKEYHGYLMSADHRHESSEYVCVDRHFEVVPGSERNRNGALFYLVEGRCDVGNLPCSPYINGAELACVVCSK